MVVIAIIMAEVTISGIQEAVIMVVCVMDGIVTILDVIHAMRVVAQHE
jgi:hypothetical protein